MLCSENYSFSRSIEKLHINTHMLCVIIYLLHHLSIVANNIARNIAILIFFELCNNSNYWSYTYILPASVMLGLKNPGFKSQIDWQTDDHEAFEKSRWNVALMKIAGSEQACLQFFSIIFILRFNIYNHVILETNVLSVSWLNLQNSRKIQKKNNVSYFDLYDRFSYWVGSSDDLRSLSEKSHIDSIFFSSREPSCMCRFVIVDLFRTKRVLFSKKWSVWKW